MVRGCFLVTSYSGNAQLWGIPYIRYITVNPIIERNQCNRNRFNVLLLVVKAVTLSVTKRNRVTVYMIIGKEAAKPMPV